MANGQACCAHDHDCEAADCGPAYSLHKHINFSGLWALNVDQSAGGNAKLIFREWHDRLNFAAPAVQSNADDPEILIHVPFDGSVKLKAICVIGGSEGTAPAEMKAYLNRDDLDFGTASELPPQQKWELQENLRGEIEYPTKVTKFNGVHSIDLHFPSNFGAATTKIHFIGFKGEFQKVNNAEDLASAGQKGGCYDGVRVQANGFRSSSQGGEPIFKANFMSFCLLPDESSLAKPIGEDSGRIC